MRMGPMLFAQNSLVPDCAQGHDDVNRFRLGRCLAQVACIAIIVFAFLIRDESVVEHTGCDQVCRSLRDRQLCFDFA
jgi:hypothetical protein